MLLLWIYINKLLAHYVSTITCTASTKKNSLEKSYEITIYSQRLFSKEYFDQLQAIDRNFVGDLE